MSEFATPEEVRAHRETFQRSIRECERNLIDAAREFANAEERLRYLQEKRCAHPNQTHADGGWQGTADIWDCPDCRRQKVSD